MDDLVRVVGYRSERQATAAATDLVARGIGASVRDARVDAGSSPEHSPQPVDGPFGVYVVPDDRLRALELLGLLDDRTAQIAHTEQIKRGAPPLKILIPVLLGAFILIPVAAFLLTYKLSGG